MNSHSTIEFITVIDEIYLFILNFISIKITYSTILNKLNEQRSVLSKVQRTFLFPWNNHSTVQISRSFRTPFARLRRKLLRTIRSVEKRNELKTITTLLDLLLLLRCPLLRNKPTEIVTNARFPRVSIRPSPPLSFDTGFLG